MLTPNNGSCNQKNSGALNGAGIMLSWENWTELPTECLWIKWFVKLNAAFDGPMQNAMGWKMSTTQSTPQTGHLGGSILRRKNLRKKLLREDNSWWKRYCNEITSTPERRSGCLGHGAMYHVFWRCSDKIKWQDRNEGSRASNEQLKKQDCSVNSQCRLGEIKLNQNERWITGKKEQRTDRTRGQKLVLKIYASRWTEQVDDLMI